MDFVDGRHKTTVIPSLSMRKDQFLLSASYARYSSDFFASNAVIPTVIPGSPNIVTSRSDHVTRKESDVTAGYFVVPNVAVSLGFKYATEDRSYSFAGAAPVPFVDNTVRVILLGVSAAFPIYDRLSLTGQLAYGPGRAKTRYLNLANPPDTNNTRYAISELGVSYALGMESAYFRGASIGLGYRSQVVRTKGTGPARDSRRIYRDEREGIVASLNVAI
ncbi:hypothetical protein ACHMW6_15725 [Pseudoduganella sp. UC29_106]|uniref:hypothetical protein n=1 Tax=Pseudoduganella sp. UC29_106 TaxID=3374553 RepID=UPI00375724C4